MPGSVLRVWRSFMRSSIRSFNSFYAVGGFTGNLVNDLADIVEFCVGVTFAVRNFLLVEVF